MTDPELVAKLRDLNASAAFNRWAGFEIVSAQPGRVELKMAWRDEAAQYAGFLHAGLVGALIDTACGFAAFTRAGAVLASHFSVNCLAPAVGSEFHETGEVTKAGRRQIFTRAELFAVSADGSRKLVATGETILMVSEA